MEIAAQQFPFLQTGTRRQTHPGGWVSPRGCYTFRLPGPEVELEGLGGGRGLLRGVVRAPRRGSACTAFGSSHKKKQSGRLRWRHRTEGTGRDNAECFTNPLRSPFNAGRTRGLGGAAEAVPGGGAEGPPDGPLGGGTTTAGGIPGTGAGTGAGVAAGGAWAGAHGPLVRRRRRRREDEALRHGAGPVDQRGGGIPEGSDGGGRDAAVRSTGGVGVRSADAKQGGHTSHGRRCVARWH